nr:hypothetical protein [Tanacetum cinerariifolium]
MYQFQTTFWSFNLGVLKIGIKSQGYGEPEVALQAPPSPDYMPDLEEAEQAPLSQDYIPGLEHADDEIVAEDQPYAEDASP